MFRFQCDIYNADDGEAWELDSHQVPLALKICHWPTALMNMVA